MGESKITSNAFLSVVQKNIIRNRVIRVLCMSRKDQKGVAEGES